MQRIGECVVQRSTTGRAVTLDRIETHLAIHGQVVCEHRRVSEENNREAVALLQRSDEVAGAGDDVGLLPVHAAAGVQRENDRHRLNGLLERVDDLWYAVFHHLEIVGADIQVPAARAR